VDKELNDRIIGYIVYTDKSLREKEESVCEVGRVFPRHVPCTYLTGKSPLSRPRVACTLRLYNYLLRFHLTISSILNSRNIPEPLLKIILKTRKIFLKKLLIALVT